MRKSLMPALLFIILMGSLVLAQQPAANEEARLLRFPDVGQEKIAFIYGGDLYTVPRSGGQATRITSHEGLEFFPKISPNGNLIAFTGQYDGDESVYSIPINGGEPKRLTFHPAIQNTTERFGPDNVVMGWSKDGQKVLYRSRKEAMSWWEGRAYLVDVKGGLSEPLPMASAGFTSLSPDGNKAAYCPIYRDFRTWKRYKGGMAQDVWIYDLKTDGAEKITDWIGTDNMPMWYGAKIYFNSDRTSQPDSAGTLNIFCYDIQTKQTRQVTHFTEYDVRWPSLGWDAIAFENGGYINLLELPSETVHKVPVNLITDRHTVRAEFVKVSDKISDYDISPDGHRAIFSARGDIFTVPAKEGNTRNLSSLSDSREGSPHWSPDGKWIIYNSDSTGEEEFYLMAQDGKGNTRLTSDGHCHRFDAQWSPDSKKIAFSDKDNKLYYIDITTKKQVLVDQSPRAQIRNYSWSPDSRFLAYSKPGENEIWAIHIYSLTDGVIHQVTPGYTNDDSPIFDPDGKYLYFLSERNFNPILSNYEFTSVNNAITNLYLIVLSKTEKSPFAPKSDEVLIGDKKNEKSEADKKESDKGDRKSKDDDLKKAVDVKIDFDGIYDRQVAFDLSAGNIDGLAAISGAVFYTTSPIYGLMGKIGKDENILHKYTIKDKKDDEFAVGLSSYAITPSGEKILMQKGSDFHISGTSGKKGEFEDNKLDLSQMEMRLDRMAEYGQMYDEVWRMERDFFYDSNMHGVDWKKMHDRYAVLIPYVINRYDLTYIISEMVSELCCSHTYIGGGETPKIHPSNIGLLGVDFEIDHSVNKIKISRLLCGENWDEELRSPLLEPGIDIKPGEYLLAIDGHPVTADIDPYSLTANTVGRTIILTVNSKPTIEGAREITVKPIPSEEMLRYYNWVESERRYVDSISGGKIGYIHIPDMGGFGLVRFMKMFYHQAYKDGLIIDVRYNGGGFVSHLILDRLRQEVKAMWVDRNTIPSPNGIKAHMITLLNQFSCSDGDYFPYFFREYKMGPLLGNRSWGGVVGINGFPALLDGGYFTVPGGTLYNLKGQWVMENIGVEPDIVVDNLPGRLAKKYDDQLDQAIKYLMGKIKEEPRILPPRPAPPTPR
ncbi:MAG: PDZ domain-containing protein [candidate division Zixibacteria bacterium]|nr:PDZ domain-containing protein [candidate division Zixibacteria bacterium]